MWHVTYWVNVRRVEDTTVLSAQMRLTLNPKMTVMDKHNIHTGKVGNCTNIP